MSKAEDFRSDREKAKIKEDNKRGPHKYDDECSCDGCRIQWGADKDINHFGMYCDCDYCVWARREIYEHEKQFREQDEKPKKKKAPKWQPITSAIESVLHSRTISKDQGDILFELVNISGVPKRRGRKLLGEITEHTRIPKQSRMKQWIRKRRPKHKV